MALWHRLLILAGLVLLSVILAKLLDRRLLSKNLAPGAETRYRVLRRSVMATVVGIGILSALFVVPQVRAVAGGLLASSAVVGLSVGFAARAAIANFVSGLLIATTQPLRLGDSVQVAGADGVVEEIGLAYTFIHNRNGDRFVIPNEKLASEVIRNSTIGSSARLAEATVDVPLSADVTKLVEELRRDPALGPATEVVLSGVADRATIRLRAWAPDELSAMTLASELRLRAHSTLRAHGAYG
jgi:small-conductance mechanosensitive channel